MNADDEIKLKRELDRAMSDALENFIEGARPARPGDFETEDDFPGALFLRADVFTNLVGGPPDERTH